MTGALCQLSNAGQKEAGLTRTHPDWTRKIRASHLTWHNKHTVKFRPAARLLSKFSKRTGLEVMLRGRRGGWEAEGMEWGGVSDICVLSRGNTTGCAPECALLVVLGVKTGHSLRTIFVCSRHDKRGVCQNNGHASTRSTRRDKRSTKSVE